MKDETNNVKPFPRDPGLAGDPAGISAFSLSPAAVPPDFVARVMRGLPEHLAPTREPAGLGSWKWAAALLIFSAALGYGFSVARQAADSVDSIASIATTPSEADAGILSAP
ncbi:MAG: hypothetical protein ACRD16_00350 [Thermoanaerobaculia bacterium]